VILNPSIINLKVGLEIHQQLATRNKLFCACGCKESGKYESPFFRTLRPTQSELGLFDRAALFEFKKIGTIKYYAAPEASCLVEADEEPPHEVDKEALESSLIFALALRSNIVDEVHIMRKIVIDGSNTSGFQRTMLIATGGYIEINGKNIGVQSVSLEEDAAKLISDSRPLREYGLDRLGIPLVEIALEPICGEIEDIVKVASKLGRLLRASKKVTRGLGSIRQDVNISVENGEVVEVKGVQQLDQLAKVIEYEMFRQHGLILIAQKIRSLRRNEEIKIGDMVESVTDILKQSSSKKVTSLTNKDIEFRAIKIGGFAGILGYEPYPGIRIGKELGELVRFYGIGGILHSDELPAYGITRNHVDQVRNRLGINSDRDAFIIVGGTIDKIEFAIESIVQRLKKVSVGVCAETRSATPDGKTTYSRPRPGSSRMYPETDIYPIPIHQSVLDALQTKVPKSLDEYVRELTIKYGLNVKLAEQIFDSHYLNLFEEIVSSTKISPTFVASKLTEDIVNLQRQGYDVSILKDGLLLDIFKKFDAGVIAKESIVLLFENVLKGEAKSIDEAMTELGITTINDQELERELDMILDKNMRVIKEKGIASLGTLMGRSMAILRGKADGEKVSIALRKKLEERISSENYNSKRGPG
jgi:glutamyl-tRNA(Gln) amidotransferase subunit E